MNDVLKTGCLLLAGLVAMTGMAADPVVELVNGEEIVGPLRQIKDGSLTVTKGSRTIPMADIRRVRVTPRSTPAPTGSGGGPARVTKTVVHGPNGVIVRETTKSKTESDEGKAEKPAAWQLLLRNGDRLTGELTEWGKDDLTIKLALRNMQMKVPIARVHEIWHADAVAVAQVRRRYPETRTNDVAFVEKDSILHAVEGACGGREDESILFRYKERERKLAAEGLLGVRYAERASAEEEAPSLYQTVYLMNGDRISGQWTGIRGTTLDIEAAASGQKLSLRVPEVVEFLFHSPRFTYLSDLQPATVEEVAFFDRTLPFRCDETLSGGPIRVGGHEYLKGIAMHSRCVLTYEIGGEYAEFLARLGFELPAGRLGRAAVRVAGDGKELFADGDFRAEAAPQPVRVSVTNVNELTLEVDFGENDDVGDRVLWADARLVRPGDSE